MLDTPFGTHGSFSLLLLQPPLCSDFSPLDQFILSLKDRLLPLFRAERRVVETREHLAGEFIAQTTVLQSLFVDAAVVQRTDFNVHLRRPEGLALNSATSLALSLKVFAGPTVYSAYRGQVIIRHVFYLLSFCVFISHFAFSLKNLRSSSMVTGFSIRGRM